MRVHWYTMSKQSGRGHYAGAPVHYEQTVRARALRGYAGTFEQTVRAGAGAVWVHRYTMSKQSGPPPAGLGAHVAVRGLERRQHMRRQPGAYTRPLFSST